MDWLASHILSALRFVWRLILVLLLGITDLLRWWWPRFLQKTAPLRTRIYAFLSETWQRKFRKPVHIALMVIVISIVSVNGIVRRQGGRPSFFSTSHFFDKVVAVSKLGLHLPLHVVAGCRKKPSVLFEEAAKRHKIPVALIRAVAWTESRFRPHVISESGAMGFMQLMPATAYEMGVRDPFDAADNINGGSRYLAQLWRRYNGNIMRVAAAYHAGPNAVATHGPVRVGPKTKRYMNVVSRRVRELKTQRASKHRPGRLGL